MPTSLARTRFGSRVLIAAPSLIVGVIIGSLVAGPGLLTRHEAAAEPGGPPSLTDGADGNAPRLSSGAMWHPWSPGPGELGSNPMAFTADHLIGDRTAKKVFVTFMRNEDTPTAELRNTSAVADDNGRVFKPYNGPSTTFGMTATTRLHDGSILSATFVPLPLSGEHRIGFGMAASTDLGTSWTSWTAPLIENKWKLNWYRVHRDLMELPDGTLLLGGYGNGTIDGVTKEYSLIFQSTDGGKTFTQRSAVNAGSSFSTNEMGFTRTGDGRLIAMMRGTEPNPRPPAMPITQSFSDDDGRTWGPVKRYLPPPGMPDNGVMPQPMLQPNGQLLMTYGRPDNNVVVSRDGTGKTWDDGSVIYSRYPGEGALRRWMGSSGNMDIAQLNASTSLAFGDTCHAIWLCREYGHDNKVWTKIVDAKGPGVGKIDLTTKVADDIVGLSGTVVAPDERFPEQRLKAMVDGSSEYRAAARLKNSSPVTIKLDRNYNLNRVGLMMDQGRRNSAVVQVSTDNKSWSKPVVETGARTDWAMQYSDIDPSAARYVRITPGSEAPLTAITEIELYADDTMTFENDAVTSTPRDVRDTRYAYVADEGAIPGYDHSRARMVLVDADQSARAEATFVQKAPAGDQHAAFGFEGYGYGTGAIWEVLGKDANGEVKVAYRLLFSGDSPNGAMKLRYWDGDAWQDAGSVGPFIPNKVWMGVTIDSDADGATVRLNGEKLATVTHRLNDVSTFTGLRAQTGMDPVDVGNMEHSYDDVVIAPR
ncbi:exo-alpha-sialidase [Microlunatus soli]|uniref:F5/8 type C domain-containing protein n=1 Tax=Microlunatus soli TaxID=630515 RepID=A0A1H1MIY5_9ACTN|nr:exo-alpha-sialidase [Microlunatus soli]SDR86791.1 F5/8 type C domain-containing protein [Microlunatus soli]